jgi:hypothetical protein
MMNRIIIGTILFLLIMGACHKEPEWQDMRVNTASPSVKTFTRDQIHDAMARVLAIALTDRQVRLFLHSEIARQFTGDFDILYDVIKDKEFKSENYGQVSFYSLIKNVAREAGIDFSPLENASSMYKNLQISSPVYFDDWDPETYSPLVISLHIDYQEGENQTVRAYDAQGHEMLFTESDIKNPFLLVRQAERVDSNGMMRVDPDGFVIPENERSVTSLEAYEQSGHSLKSAGIQQAENVIEVLDKSEFDEVLKSRRSIYSGVSPAPKIPPAPLTEPVLKSASSVMVDAPGNFTVHPAGPGTIQMNWTQVQGAVSYEIFKQYLTYSNMLMATVDGNQINYFDQYLGVGDHYTYSVRAVDASGSTSPLTAGNESYASWRTNGQRDVIDKILIDSDCWSWCCGLFDGKIELQYKTSYLLTPSNTNVSYPSSGLNNLGQKTRDQQKGKWCTYSHYLFPWDVRNTSYSYRFKLVEDDGDGNGTTIKLGSSFKIQLLKIIDWTISEGIEFKIADKDEDFGEVIILYWDYKNGPSYFSDGYNLIPDKGKARMYLRQ